MEQPINNKSVTKPTHFPGFDGIRLLAALSVMFSHAFLIARGSEDTEPFVRLLGGGNILGLYGVFTFFVISGFLLARSLTAEPSAITYTVNRTLRILPAFAAYIVVTVFVIGPLCSSVGLSEYFSWSNTFPFLKESLNTFGDWTLKGVFAYDGGYLVPVVNGSLWSLRYEALSYVFLLLLWTVFRSNTLVTGLLVILSILTWTSASVASTTKAIAYTLPYFSGGVLMYWIYARYGTNLLCALSSLAIFLATCAFGFQAYAFPIFGAYLILFLGERSNPGSAIAKRVGDCSYGLYLYGWPAEQIAKQVSNTQDPFMLLLIAVPLAAVLALISCHVVEKPAMGCRKSAMTQIRSAVTSVFAHARGLQGPAIFGAKLSFILTAAAILLVGRWWYFIESMLELLLAVMAGSILAMAVGALRLRWARTLMKRSLR